MVFCYNNNSIGNNNNDDNDHNDVDENVYGAIINHGTAIGKSSSIYECRTVQSSRQPLDQTSELGPLSSPVIVTVYCY